MRIRLLCAAALLCALAPAAPAGARSRDAFTAEITKAAISGHHATFTFRAVHGPAATGFMCTLTEVDKVIAQPQPCGSPQHFRRLAAGTWVFSVYAVAINRDSPAVARMFTIA